MFTNSKNKLVRRKREKIVALNGAGWPAQAKRTHVHHTEYARRTLYAYMPCAGLRGTDYIDDVVRDQFGNNWEDALRAFVTDKLQKWCPTWIKRNYEKLNQVDLAEVTARSPIVFEEPPPPVKEEPHSDGDQQSSTPKLAPPVVDDATTIGDDAQRKMEKALASGEPPIEPDHERPEAYESDHHWNRDSRPPEELHSSLGPNLNAEGRSVRVEPLQQDVNPETFDWHSSWQDVNIADLAAKWEALKQETPDIDVPNVAHGELDDFRQLFVTLVVQHAEDVVKAWQENKTPKPLRLMLLGTAGTGNTYAASTMLSQLHERNLFKEFTRVAAPTGTAAFNIGFNATTVHRLIHWFDPTFFQSIKNPEHLAALHFFWKHTADGV